MEDKADCVWTATNTGFVYEMANSPRGYTPVYMKTPEEDPGMWERFKKVNPGRQRQQSHNWRATSVGREPSHWQWSTLRHDRNTCK